MSRSFVLDEESTHKSFSFNPRNEFYSAAFNQNVADNLALLDSGRYSDLTIRCHNRQWSVHKAIICAKSEFFARTSDGRFREGLTGQIDLPEDEPAIVHKMIQYLYTGSYEDEADEYWGTTLAHRAVLAKNPDAKAARSTKGRPRPPLSGVDVYIIADKYLIPGLKKLALERLRDWSASPQRLRDSALIVQTIYAKTEEEDDLRKDLAVEMMMRHYPQLLKNEHWNRLFNDSPEIKVDLLEAGAMKYTKLEKENEVLKNEVKMLAERLKWLPSGPWQEASPGPQV